jgi:predicted membrane protein
MKMGSALFWGLLLIIIGLSMVFRIVFNIDFPLFKVIFAFILIFLGVRLLFGSFGDMNITTPEESVIFGERKFHTVEDRKEYSVVFGSGVFDLRDMPLEGSSRKIKISTVFGGSEIKISKNTPVRIRVEAAFAGVNLPNGNSAAFGNTNYQSPDFDPALPHLEVRIDVVFGGAEVKLY